jgi:hypothetical protein
MGGIVARVLNSAIPIAFIVLGLLFGSQEYHWDTLERAVILENPGDYLHSWDGSPRSQFLSFAHILELPLAAVVRLVAGSPSGMRSLILFELLCAAATLWVIARIVRQHDGTWHGAVAAQLMIACCWGFWKMGTSGEERVLGMATLLLFLWAFWNTLLTGRRAGLVGTSLAWPSSPICPMLCCCHLPFLAWRFCRKNNSTSGAAPPSPCRSARWSRE